MARRRKDTGAVERAVPCAEVQPAPWNPRRHDDRNLAAITESLRRFGQLKPIVCRPLEDGALQVVAGHGTLAAATALGWEQIRAWIAPMTDVEARAFAVQDNRTTDLSTWDPGKLLDIVRDNQVGSLGFSDDEISKLCGDLERELLDAKVEEGVEAWGRRAGEETEPLPEPPEEPRCRRGDLWQLGEHRLLVGDSTSEADVARLFGKAEPFMMVTDPPYGVEYEPEWRVAAGASRTKQVGRIANDDRASWAATYRLFPGAVAYVWHAARFTGEVAMSLAVAGLEPRAQIIWVKRRFALSRGHYHWRHEPCWYAVREGQDARWASDRKQQTVWADIVDAGGDPDGLFAAAIDQDTLYAFKADRTTVWEMPHDRAVGGGHSTQKPVEAMARPIRNHGGPRDVVFDPFLGTGTTLVACEQLGRRCVGLELEPRYADVIVRRWENLTGEKARKARR